MDLGCETCGAKRCLADCDMGRGLVLGFRCVGGWVERVGVVFWSFWGPLCRVLSRWKKKKSRNCGAGSPGTVGWRLKGLIGDGLGELG